MFLMHFSRLKITLKGLNVEYVMIFFNQQILYLSGGFLPLLGVCYLIVFLLQTINLTLRENEFESKI